MKRYIIGHGLDAWSFDEAYKVARDGDIIELEKGYNFTIPKGESRHLEKCITIEGHLEKNNEGILYTNTIYGEFILKSGAHVTLKNLWIEPDEDKAALMVEEMSILNMENVVLTTKVENYSVFILYADTGSTVYGCNLLVTNQGCFNGCEATFENSKFRDKVKLLNKSRVTFVNSILELPTQSNNSVHIEDSSANFVDCNISGSTQNDLFPTMWVIRSEVDLVNTMVSRESTVGEYVSALWMTDTSLLKSNGGNYSGLVLQGSTAHVEDLSIESCVDMDNGSLMLSKGILNFRAHYPERCNLYMEKNSIFRGEEIYLNKVINPNIYVGEKCTLSLNSLSFWDSSKKQLKSGDELLIAHPNSSVSVPSVKNMFFNDIESN
ncbi:hypothetical protein OZX68_01015 [Streptococcaceae bacterium ESL0729]|nr:hypothetical protein OZX68_01015 [Streptococcaceae bacterium ESL0729]